MNVGALSVDRRRRDRQVGGAQPFADRRARRPSPGSRRDSRDRRNRRGSSATPCPGVVALSSQRAIRAAGPGGHPSRAARRAVDGWERSADRRCEARRAVAVAATRDAARAGARPLRSCPFRPSRRAAARGNASPPNADRHAVWAMRRARCRRFTSRRPSSDRPGACRSSSRRSSSPHLAGPPLVAVDVTPPWQMSTQATQGTEAARPRIMRLA